MTRPVIVIGAGGHAKVLIDAMLLMNLTIIGIVDADDNKLGERLFDIPILGGDLYIKKFAAEEIDLVNAIGSIAIPDLRERIYLRFKELGYSFRTVIHPAAVISPYAILDEGVQVMAGAVIQAGCEVGCNSIINTRSALDHDCRIGRHVHIAPGTTLSGSVSVEDRTHIGTGATIIQGRKIGKGAIVGAGAVVINNVSDSVKVMGIPAQ